MLATKPVAVAVVWPFDQEYVTVPTFPVAVTVALPVDPPKQALLIWVVEVAKAHPLGVVNEQGVAVVFVID